VTKNSPHKILLIDSHPTTLSGLTNLLSEHQDLEVCGAALDARQALTEIKATKPEMVILENALNSIHSFELLTIIRSKHPQLRILCFALYEEIFYAERALRCGANGYLMKTEAPKDLITAIHAILDGKIYVTQRVKASMLGDVSKRNSSSTAPQIHSLSNREIQIVQQIGESCDNRRIAHQLQLSIRTIEAHRSRIKGKLNLRTPNDLIKFAVSWVEKECYFSKSMRA
jgi:DNA-binding NarL/FixJ family response regulator